MAEEAAAAYARAEYHIRQLAEQVPLPDPSYYCLSGLMDQCLSYELPIILVLMSSCVLSILIAV